VGLIKHKHLEAIFWEFLEMQARRIIRRDNGADSIRFSMDQVLPERDNRRNVELRLKLFLPLLGEYLWADNQYSGEARSRDQLADNQTCAYRFSESDIIGEKRDGKSAAEGDKIADLMAVGSQAVTPSIGGFEIFETFYNDGISQIPFKAGSINPVFLRRFLAA
jgi:hypothetical protein